MQSSDKIEGYFICPNCGNKITNPTAQICENCTYDFGQLISCPNKDESNICLLTDNPCMVKGLSFEECLVYQPT